MTQTADGFLVNYRVEVTEGTAAVGGAAVGERLRALASPGLNLRRGSIQSQEIRDDANAGAMRLGGKMVDGSYNVELSQGSFDTLLEGFFRSTWVAPVAVTFNNGAALTSIQVTSTSQLTFAGTTVPTAFGLRVGDVFRLTDMSTSANNNVNCIVRSIAGSVVNVYGTPLTIQAADTACTLTIHKKLAQATTPTRRTFTFEQYYEELDLTRQFLGCRITSLRLQLQPNGMVNATFGFIGLDETRLASGASPYFTSPTSYTSIALVATDASVYYNDAAITTLTGMDLTFTIAADGPEVIGSVVKPRTYDNRMTATGSITGLVTDFADFTLYDAETEFQIVLHLVEPETQPKSHFTLYLPAVKITDIDMSLGGDSALLETLALNLQPRVAATGFDAGVLTITTAA